MNGISSSQHLGGLTFQSIPAKVGLSICQDRDRKIGTNLMWVLAMNVFIDYVTTFGAFI